MKVIKGITCFQESSWLLEGDIYHKEVGDIMFGKEITEIRKGKDKPLIRDNNIILQVYYFMNGKNRIGVIKKESKYIKLHY